MLEIIISSAVSVLSIFISYVIGRIEANHSSKIEAVQRMYKSWHMPLIGLLYESSIWNDGFSGVSSEYRERFYHLIAENLQFMDIDTLEWADVFLSSYQYVYGDRSKLSDGTKLPVPLTPTRLDETFDDLICSALRHSQKQAHLLKQPEIGEHVLKLYLDAQGFRQKLGRAASGLVDTNEQ